MLSEGILLASSGIEFWIFYPFDPLAAREYLCGCGTHVKSKMSEAVDTQSSVKKKPRK